jgi:hypothetical protein
MIISLLEYQVFLSVLCELCCELLFIILLIHPRAYLGLPGIVLAYHPVYIR